MKNDDPSEFFSEKQKHKKNRYLTVVKSLLSNVSYVFINKNKILTFLFLLSADDLWISVSFGRDHSFSSLKLRFTVRCTDFFIFLSHVQHERPSTIISSIKLKNKF